MRCGCHTTTTAPWSSELRFMHSKSNIPTNKSVEFSCKDFGSSLLAENVTPNNFSSLLSPLGGASMNTDMSCRKRVKLTDLDVNIPLSCRINASSTALGGRQCPRSDDPKTSKFALLRN
ncbi:hypothetical protein ACB098_12G149400 [Castanea mollissima]